MRAVARLARGAEGAAAETAHRLSGLGCFAADVCSSDAAEMTECLFVFLPQSSNVGRDRGSSPQKILPLIARGPRRHLGRGQA